MNKDRSIDFNLNTIAAAAYRPWTPFNATILFGIFSILVGLAINFFGPSIQELPADLVALFTGLAILYGVGIIVYDVLTRRDKLKLATSAGSYKFSGKDLGDVPHAIRGAS